MNALRARVACAVFLVVYMFAARAIADDGPPAAPPEIGRASCRERV